MEPPVLLGGRWEIARYGHDARILNSTHLYGLFRTARAVAATRTILE